MGVEQLEIFPSVTTDELQATKKLLREYPRIKTGITRLQKRIDAGEVITDTEREALAKHRKLIQHIDDAIASIPDDEVRQIVTDRYFNSKSHKYTIRRFRAIMGERTVNRRIETGVETVAEALKMWGNQYLK